MLNTSQPRSVISHARIRQLYYQLKPLMPKSLRIKLRQLEARKLLKKTKDFWPIDPRSATKPLRWRGWPDGKQFAFVLSHDVEGPAGMERVIELMRIEEELGFRSVFNFIPEGNYSVPAGLRRTLERNGFEVGVHDLRHDGKLYNSRDEFLRSAERINQYLCEWGAVGFRSAFMLHNLDWIHDLEVLYDSSTFDTDVFEPQPEGVGTIFPFWCSRKGRSRGYVEIPYTLPQDSTLFLVLQERNNSTWNRKLNWIAEHGGMAFLNVHPDYMDMGDGRSKWNYDARLYREFLIHVKDHYNGAYWQALPKEVAEFYRRWQLAEERTVVTASPAESAASIEVIVDNPSCGVVLTLGTLSYFVETAADLVARVGPMI
jgi:peptidoglycan/xylan/chitin deacetylase (PgdA/CDA1 family)